MKLKKIASLMLAGIMAVSMLAGCGEGKKDDSSSSSSTPVNPATTSVAKFANNELSGDDKGIFEFGESNDFDVIVEAVATDKDKFSTSDIENAWKNRNASSNATLKSAVEGKIKADYNVMSQFSGMNAVANNNLDYAVASVYTVSGGLDAETAIKAVMNTFNNDAQYTGIKDANYPGEITVGGVKYRCDYNAEIGAIRVVSEDHSNQSAWVVAIVVTNSVTKIG